MANLSESAVWESGIYQLEVTDPVLGGPTGVSNTQAKQLGNRTLWLKQEVDSLVDSVDDLISAVSIIESDVAAIKNTGLLTNGLMSFNKGVEKITSPSAITSANVAGKLYVIAPSSGLVNVSLPSALTYPAGAMITIAVVEGSTSYPNAMVSFTGSGSTLVNYSYLNIGDSVTVVANPDTNEWIFLPGRTDIPIGVVVDCLTTDIPYGYLVANGATVSRTSYKRLFNKIGVTYGIGDGVSTFNLPDCRGVFRRGLDSGRGFDSGRILGSYQADELKAHTHDVFAYKEEPGGTPLATSGAFSGKNLTLTTTSVGGTETRPKNIAVVPILRY